MEKEVEAALEVLRRGGLILYPTDTVWGIGCDATDEKAVERIYELKRSVNKHSMLVLCRDADMIVRYVNKAPGIAFEVLEMATKPLTLILEGAVGVAPNLIPETGQTLPLISRGGSSMLFTMIAFGMILSVSRQNDEQSHDRPKSETLYEK